MSIFARIPRLNNLLHLAHINRITSILVLRNTNFRNDTRNQLCRRNIKGGIVDQVVTLADSVRRDLNDGLWRCRGRRAVVGGCRKGGVCGGDDETSGESRFDGWTLFDMDTEECSRRVPLARLYPIELMDNSRKLRTLFHVRFACRASLQGRSP